MRKAFDPSQYPHVFCREIYLYETDAFGHLNNVNFIAYMEGARFDLFKEMDVFDPRDLFSLGLILARIECDYEEVVRFGDRLNQPVTLSPELVEKLSRYRGIPR